MGVGGWGTNIVTSDCNEDNFLTTKILLFKEPDFCEKNGTANSKPILGENVEDKSMRAYKIPALMLSVFG